MNILGKLSIEQYSKWKIALLEMQNSDLNQKLAEKTMLNLDKVLEIQQLRSALFKAEVRTKTLEHSQQTTEFHNIRKEIEQQLGFELTDCIIDEITLDIKKP